MSIQIARPQIEVEVSEAEAPGINNLLAESELSRHINSCWDKARNAKLDILPLMRCPKCHSEQLERKSADEIVCKGCSTHFKTGLNIFYIH